MRWHNRMTRANVCRLALAIPLVVALLFSLYTESIDRPACEALFGVNVALLALFEYCFVIPLMIFAFSVYGAKKGIQTIFCEQVEGSPELVMGRAKKYVQGIVLILLPVFGMGLVLLGAQSFGATLGDRSLHELQHSLASQCGAP